MKIWVLEEMTQAGINKLDEYRTRKDAEEVREFYDECYTRIVEKEVESTGYDLEDAFLGLCGMMECSKCPVQCYKSGAKDWKEMGLSEQAALIKNMVMKLKEKG